MRIYFLFLFFACPTFASDTALDAAKRIVGKYKGEWTMFAVQEDGKVFEKTKWTDVLTASNPVATEDRAHVSVIDIMTFPDGSTRKSQFVEGYLANPDGSVGNRFYEIQGQLVSFMRLSKDDWSFHTTPGAWELTLLGFDPKTVLSASHVTVKSTTYEGDKDTDHVTRTSTIQWKAADGGTKTVQFVSMKGYHVRTE